MKICPTCLGEGEVEAEFIDTRKDLVETGRVVCPECEGMGEIDEEDFCD